MRASEPRRGETDAEPLCFQFCIAPPGLMIEVWFCYLTPLAGLKSTISSVDDSFSKSGQHNSHAIQIALSN